MAEQERSWSNGDIEGFMKYYEKSDELSFASKNGLTKGYNTLLNRYKESYPGKQEMGELNFELLEHRNLGDEHVLVIGSWKLLNNQNNPSGYFSLVWKKTADGWKIIHDHTS
jgi:ketosteroid isomerase-like protein